MKENNINEITLSDKQTKLVKLMIPVVQQYYNKDLSEEEVRAVIIDNLKDIQEVMGKILSSELELENKKIIDAIDDSEVSLSVG